MIYFLYYIACVWGITHILVSSKIFSPFRNWVLIKSNFFGELLECYQCTSFWVSIVMYFVFDKLSLNTINIKIGELNICLDPILYGFIGSGLVSFLSVLLSLMISKSNRDI